MAYYCIISKHKAIKKSLYAKERINWIYINYNGDCSSVILNFSSS